MTLCLAAAAPAGAQTDRLARAYGQVDQSAQALQAARMATGAAGDTASRSRLSADLRGAQTQARVASAVLTPELALVDARLDELGPAVEAEAPDVAVQRDTLQSEHARLDSAVKRANLVVLEAGQLVDQLAAADAAAVSAQLNSKARSPLNPQFWVGAARALPPLQHRLSVLGAESAARRAAAGHVGLLWLLGGLIAAAAVLAILGRWLHASGLRYAARHAAANSSLRTSAFALWTLVAGFVTPVVAWMCVFHGLKASRWLAPDAERLASGAGVGLLVGVYIAVLSETLLAVDRPEWRLLKIETSAARKVRPYGWAAAGLMGFSAAAGAALSILTPPDAVATAINAVIAIASIGVVVAILLAIGQLRVHAEANEHGAAGMLQSRIATTGLIGMWPFAAFILLRGAQGYVTYAISLSQWLIWAGVVLGTFFLLARFTDDASRVIFGGPIRFTRAAHARFGVRDNTLVQFGVLVSAALRLLLLVGAAIALMAPFGAGYTTLFDTLASLGGGVRLGGIILSPAAILRAAAVFGIGLIIVRALRGWLVKSYLPTTSLDAGAVNSIGVVTSYLGVAAAVLWALAALGVRTQQLAFLLSALSVGIGFGLQAITQNFVSGLILLVERPVRIGDRVRLGDQEGRITRISVRATQILTESRDRLVVPNSELITKTVMSLSDASAAPDVSGRLPVAVDRDLDAVREAILEILSAHPSVLQTPPPSARLDDVEAGQAVFAWSGALTGDAEVDEVRSELWLAIIRRLRVTPPGGAEAPRVEAPNGRPPP